MGTISRTETTLIHAALLTYNQFAVSEIEFLLHKLGFTESLLIQKGELAQSQNIDGCEMVFAVLDHPKHIEKYKQNIAELKIVKQVPVVIAVTAEEKTRIEIENNRFEIFADDFLFLPVREDLFSKTIKTRIVSLLIARHNEISHSDFGRNSISLGQILVEHKLINPLQLKKALDYQKGTGQRLGDALVELGYIDQDQKLHFLASQLGVPVTTARQYASADLNIIALIPEHIARRHNCLALEKTGSELTVTMTDILDLRLLDSLRDITDLSIRPVLGKPDDIATSIERYYRDITSHKDASVLMADLDEKVEYIQDQQKEDDIEAMASAGAELGIIKLVNMMIANAVRDKASDIHIEPMDKELFVRYRIDGDLRKILSPPKRSHQAIVTRIKILSNLDIAERRLPQDGQMVVKIGLREIDIRVSILPTVYGEKAVLRILDKEAFERSIANLGFTPYDERIFRSQISKPYGMIIVTGPTGSGKSTTLYSALQVIKSITRNIITVEDPVEYHMDGITQVHVNNKIGLTFASALRSILRQDPDIVLIGEIRDNETADIAIKMSMTGHLVFSTLHTNDAASSIARFVDVGIPPLLLGSSLNLILAQRLVRRVCKNCKVQYTPPQELIDQLNISSDITKFYKGEGCVNCNGTGYSGRSGIFELLVVTKEVRKLILRNAPTMEIQETAEKEGMKNLRRAGIELALQGETTIEQVIAATTEI